MNRKWHLCCLSHPEPDQVVSVITAGAIRQANHYRLWDGRWEHLSCEGWKPSALEVRAWRPVAEPEGEDMVLVPRRLLVALREIVG